MEQINNSAVSQLPHNEYLEKSLLSQLIMYGNDFCKVQNLDKDVFYTDKHQRLFVCMKAIYDKVDEVNLTTVYNETQKRGLNEWSAYELANIQSLDSNGNDIAYIASALVELAKKRKGWTVLEQSAIDILRPETDSATIIEDARTKLDNLCSALPSPLLQEKEGYTPHQS